ncbi:MAG: hypothetical protein SVS15_01160, partial [Thermodesulfobacteriota bacterium]|nr:hypothetical protein [Thermodesulfobacteriota bacterium]
MKAVDFLNLGLGAAFLAKDKVEGLFREMEKRGEISKEDAKKFIEDAKKRAEKERKALDARIQEKIKKTI